MAASGGVEVADPALASCFTQGELRSLKSQFEMMDAGGTGAVPLTELESSIQQMNIQGPLTPDEIVVIIRQQDTLRRGVLDFEGFLGVQLELQKVGGGFKPSHVKGNSSFLTSAATTLVHTISDSEKKAYVDHINRHLAGDPALQSVLPIDPSSNQLFEIAKEGILLCKLINLAVSGTIDERALNVKGRLNPWERTENHTLCLNSAKAIGCSVVNIGTEDLSEGRPHLVLGLIIQIVKIQLLADVNLKKMPELAELLDDTEEFEDFLRLPAEKVLLRWMNFHLKKAGHKKTVSNFSSDVKDGDAYTLLLHTLAPESCSLQPLEIKDPTERAKAMLAQAERINCGKYLSAKDVVDGTANLNLAFVAHLFHTRNGLSVYNGKVSYAELMEDDEQVTREERSFRMWINSLGSESHVNSLFDDVQDGWVLLKLIDKVAPGSVAWKCANQPPIKMPFKKVENCNQAIDIGKKLKFSLVNVAGTDIVQGNKKLILAYLWQLMRYNVFHLLKNLKLQGREVSDADILQWANVKVKNSGKSSRMESFKDRSLSTGKFFLDLLGAVEPRVINWSLVTQGETDEDKKQNANYIISVARKLGCSIFLLWDDIVEVPCACFEGVEQLKRSLLKYLERTCRSEGSFHSLSNTEEVWP